MELGFWCIFSNGRIECFDYFCALGFRLDSGGQPAIPRLPVVLQPIVVLFGTRVGLFLKVAQRFINLIHGYKLKSESCDVNKVNPRFQKIVPRRVQRKSARILIAKHKVAVLARIQFFFPVPCHERVQINLTSKISRAVGVGWIALLGKSRQASLDALQILMHSVISSYQHSSTVRSERLSLMWQNKA